MVSATTAINLVAVVAGLPFILQAGSILKAFILVPK
jgi:hypothetical protein